MASARETENPAHPLYPARCLELPAFGLIGLTKIVESGGDLYQEARTDGRWEFLRSLVGADRNIYGVSSLDKECPPGRYRYTLAIKPDADPAADPRYRDLFSIHVGASQWVVFCIASFGTQYGEFWHENPYELIQHLGWDFNRKLGLHIDLFSPSFGDDRDGIEFMMPVKRQAPKVPRARYVE